MSTRSVIRFKNDEVGSMIYKHWDGYPSATIPWLVDKVKTFTEKRGNDYTYFAAYILKSVLVDAEKYGLDDSPLTGWGLFKDNKEKNKVVKDSFGVDYVYTIDLDAKTIKIGDSVKNTINTECPMDEKMLKRLERIK